MATLLVYLKKNFDHIKFSTCKQMREGRPYLGSYIIKFKMKTERYSDGYIKSLVYLWCFIVFSTFLFGINVFNYTILLHTFNV